VNHLTGADVIDRVNTLQFIDSITGRLAWPLAAVALGVTSSVDRWRNSWAAFGD
jgi:hypothetical protein